MAASQAMITLLNGTFGSPPVQSDKLCQTFTPLDRLILWGEKRNLYILWRYRQLS
jgi:hypothetical protein